MGQQRRIIIRRRWFCSPMERISFRFWLEISELEHLDLVTKKIQLGSKFDFAKNSYFFNIQIWIFVQKIQMNLIFFRKYFRWIFPIFRIRSQLYSFILGYRMVGYGCTLCFIRESGRNQLHSRWARTDELFCGSVMFRTSQIRTRQFLHICYQVIFSRKIW